MWGAIAGGLSLASSLFSASAGGAEAENIANLNANLVAETGEEEARRLGRSIDQSEGLMSAMSASSGVQMSGSREAYAKDTKAENAKQLAWLNKTTAQEAQVTRMGGQIQSSQIQSQAIGSSLSAIGQIGTSLFASK